MNKKIIRNLETLPFFSKSALLAFETLKPRALYQNLQRWVATGQLIRLKNGLYVTKTFVDRFFHEESYVGLVANKLVIPSYLSLEYVLQKKGFLTEATFPITSVTLKSTRHYRNPLGSFDYHHLDERLYFGFEQRRYGQNTLYEATPMKALFDFLYLRRPRLDPEDPSTMESMRINWSQMNRLSLNALCGIILKSRVDKMRKIIPMIKEMTRGNTRQRP